MRSRHGLFFHSASFPFRLFPLQQNVGWPSVFRQQTVRWLTSRQIFLPFTSLFFFFFSLCRLAPLRQNWWQTVLRV